MTLDTLLRLADNTGIKLWAVFAATTCLALVQLHAAGVTNDTLILGGFGLFTGGAMGHKYLKGPDADLAPADAPAPATP